MGTKVQYKSCFGGYNPMRDLDGDLNGNSWALFYGEKTIPNTRFNPRTSANVYPGYDRNGLKQKMLEHEAVFKNQVHELHRLYKIQRDMMEEIKTKEHFRHRESIEPSSSSSIHGSQVPADDVRKWHLRSNSLVDPCYRRSTVSAAENVNSPLSYTNGNSTLASQVASRNGFPKELEVSESRPSKVRKRLFDLQLPADEYVDIEDDEQLDNNVSGHPSFTHSKEFKTASEDIMKLTVGKIKMGGMQEGCSSVSHCRSSTGLADLNEPINVEEVTESSPDNIFGHSTCNDGAKGVYFFPNPKTGFLGLQKEAMQKSIHGNLLGSLNSMSAENKMNGREWFSHSLEAGHGGGNNSSHCRGVQLDNQSLAGTVSQAMLDQAYPSGSHLTYHKEHLRKERLDRELSAQHRSRDYFNHNHLEPVMASQVSNPLPFLNSSNESSTWPQLMHSLGTPADNLKPKLPLFHTYHSLGSSPSLNKVLQSSVLSNHTSGDNWHGNSSFCANPCLASDVPSSNGFYQGSSSGSKYPSSVGFNHLNSNKIGNTTSLHMINGMERVFTSSSVVDLKPLKDMNLNVTFPKNVLEERVVILQAPVSADGNCKPEVHQPSFPWLRMKPTSKNEATNSRREVISIDASPPRASASLLSGKSKAMIDLNEVYNDTYVSNNHISSNNEMNGIRIVKKILGVPIFEKLGVSENRVSTFESSNTEAEHAKHERKNRLIDINVACDASLIEWEEEPVMNEVVGENHLKKSSGARNFIDLNTCLAEEDPLVPTVGSITAPEKVVVEIDLEIPAVPEEEDDFLPERDNEQKKDITPHSPDNDTEQADDDAMRTAAKVIVNISSCLHINQENVIFTPSDAAEQELLLFFADVVSASPTFGKEGSSKVMDEFEAMTLQLPETKKEDFMPKPFVPEVLKVEETGTSALPTRPRRGQARRGRQRRDFQRDILPGLVSLSRYEVTEDLQTFGGLMRAMGHPWNSGLTRRNGGRNGSGRGRRRTVVEAAPTAPSVAACTQLVQQLDNVENGLEDRSLTSWGKTTRRPRRQRCPVGNAPTVALT